MEQAVENLYKVFRLYKANPNMEGSPLYGEKVSKWNKKLFSKELRELTNEDLNRFCMKVMLTWGGVEDYKHFLPRTYELTSNFQTPYEEWLLFERLNDASWRMWPKEEVDSIEDYFLMLWDKLLNTETGKVYFTDYFGAISNVYPRFEELLMIWENNLNSNSINKFVNYYYDNYKLLVLKKKLPGWKESPKLGLRFFEWLNSDKLIELLKLSLEKDLLAEDKEKLNWIIAEITNF